MKNLEWSTITSSASPSSPLSPASADNEAAYSSTEYVVKYASGKIPLLFTPRVKMASSSERKNLMPCSIAFAMEEFADNFAAAPIKPNSIVRPNEAIKTSATTLDPQKKSSHHLSRHLRRRLFEII